MDANEFRKDLLDEVKSTAVVAGGGSSAAFTEIFANYLINAEVLPDFTYSFFTGTGKNQRKLRADGYVLDEFDFTFTLIVSDYTGDENRAVLTKTEAGQCFDRLQYFVEEAYGSKLPREIEPSTPASDLVELLRFHKTRIRKFRLLLFSDGFMSGRIQTIEDRSINDITVECQIWDVERLFRVCCSETGRQNIEIDFKAYTPSGIPCLEASSVKSGDYGQERHTHTTGTTCRPEKAV